MELLSWNYSQMDFCKEESRATVSLGNSEWDQPLKKSLPTLNLHHAITVCYYCSPSPEGDLAHLARRFAKGKVLSVRPGNGWEAETHPLTSRRTL